MIQVAGLLLQCFKAIAALFKKHALQHYDLLHAQVGPSPSRSVDFPVSPFDRVFFSDSGCSFLQTPRPPPPLPPKTSSPLLPPPTPFPLPHPGLFFGSLSGSSQQVHGLFILPVWLSIVSHVSLGLSPTLLLFLLLLLLLLLLLQRGLSRQLQQLQRLKFCRSQAIMHFPATFCSGTTSVNTLRKQNKTPCKTHFRSRRHSSRLQLRQRASMAC